MNFFFKACANIPILVYFAACIVGVEKRADAAFMNKKNVTTCVCRNIFLMKVCIVCPLELDDKIFGRAQRLVLHL